MALSSNFSLVFPVDAGKRAVIFDKLQGVQQETVGEGTHFMIPFFRVNSVTFFKLSCGCCMTYHTIFSVGAYYHGHSLSPKNYQLFNWNERPSNGISVFATFILCYYVDTTKKVAYNNLDSVNLGQYFITCAFAAKGGNVACNLSETRH